MKHYKRPECFTMIFYLLGPARDFYDNVTPHHGHQGLQRYTKFNHVEGLRR